MKVLIVGNGGREHALAWKAAQSCLVKQVYVAPGNAGTSLEPKVKNIDIEITEFNALLNFAQETAIDLTIIGPEIPLVEGIVDRFRTAGLRIFGPTQAAAQLEGSKTFAKRFLIHHQIPTARYQSFVNLEAALSYVNQHPLPVVIKADGLAAGKGVIIAATLQEAERALRDMLAGNQFGEAGHRVVIEEFLVGEEASFIVMVDGQNILPMATSQDHKRIGEGDTGLNTGGMGAYSPAPVVTEAVYQRIMDTIIKPTVEGMGKDGIPYTGFLYAGLMISPAGEPKVIEFNCRFGDPETQPIMLRMRSDLIKLCLLAVEGKLAGQKIDWDTRCALGVVLAAEGYPNKVKTGYPIVGLDIAEQDNYKIFHAGTANENNQVVTKGGRVLCITTLGPDISAAQLAAYKIAEQVSWKGCFYRQDIGYRALGRVLPKY